MPSISVMTAVSRGLRASNSSTTRGRPPVMSLVFVVSRGIFASTSPGGTSRRRCTIRCACERHGYLRTTLPVLRRLDLDGRLLLLVRRVDDDEPRQAGDLVQLLVHRDAFEHVLELHLPGLLGEDRERVRIPFDQTLALLDRLRRPSPSAARRRPPDSARARGPSRPGRRAIRCGSSRPASPSLASTTCRPWNRTDAGVAWPRASTARRSATPCRRCGTSASSAACPARRSTAPR